MRKSECGSRKSECGNRNAEVGMRNARVRRARKLRVVKIQYPASGRNSTFNRIFSTEYLSIPMNFLVIDIGTSGCRAAVVSGEGEIVSQSHDPIGIDHPRVSFAEIETDRLWLAVQQLIRSEVNKHPGITFDALGVSSMLGYVFLDQAGQPLMPAITYADNRATRETEEIRHLIPDAKFHAITGRQPSPLLLIYLGIEIVAGLLGLAVLAAADRKLKR